MFFAARACRIALNLPFFINNNLFSSLSKASLRTHTCGELRVTDVGKLVTLCGWLYNIRVNSAFLLIKDAYGVTQVILEPRVDSF